MDPVLFCLHTHTSSIQSGQQHACVVRVTIQHGPCLHTQHTHLQHPVRTTHMCSTSHNTTRAMSSSVSIHNTRLRFFMSFFRPRQQKVLCIPIACFQHQQHKGSQGIPGQYSLALMPLVADAGTLGAAAQRSRQAACLALKDVLQNKMPLSARTARPPPV